MESSINPFTGEKRDPVHPVFSNDLIVPEILGYLSVQEWKAFRLVSSEWYKMTIKQENKKVFVHLQTPDPYAVNNNDSIKHFLEFLETSNQATKSLGRYQFTNFSLEGWNSDPVGQNKNLKIYSRFSNVCSQQIRHLQLVNFRLNKGDQVFFNLLRNLAPNMKSLKIVLNNDWTGAFDYWSQVFAPADVHLNLKRLEISCSLVIFMNFVFLMKFPNLTMLKLEVEGRTIAENVIPNLVMLGPRRKKQKALLNLTHLDAIEADLDIRDLVDANLPLKHLSFRISNRFPTDHFILSLEHHAKLLETLKLLRLPFLELPPLSQFPFSARFANLKELELWGNITANLDFLMVTPLLRKLRIDLYCFEKMETQPFSSMLNGSKERFPITEDLVKNSERLLEMETFTVPSLEELAIESVLEMESWKILGAWFPRLKVLKAPLNNDSFEVVCSQWKNLSRLKLRLGSDVNDDGITGLGNGADRKSSITDLKDLCTFELEVSCGKGRLTDAAAKNGFLLMKHLSSLKLDVSELMSFKMEARLKRKIKDVQICRKPTICRPKFRQEENCCKFTGLMSALNVANFH